MRFFEDMPTRHESALPAPPVLTPSRLRDFNRAQESIDVALEQVERFEDAADDERHWAEIDAMTPEELRAAIGLTDEQIAQRVADTTGARDHEGDPLYGVTLRGRREVRQSEHAGAGAKGPVA